MKILVVGGGAREHAILKSLSEDSQVSELYSSPARPIEGVKGWDVTQQDNSQMDLVIIGPEQPIVEGLSDRLRSLNIPVFAPSAEASKLEGSKIFSKEFMKKFQIPSSRFYTVDSVATCLKQAEKFQPPYVLKADGLAGGKGVFICSTLEDLKDKAYNLFEKKSLGESGKQALLEEFQEGREVSVFILTNGKDYRLLPLARDYKRRDEGGKGPNTGGMGAIAPCPLPASVMEQIKKEIIEKTVEGLKTENYLYRGVLYIGIILSPSGPKVLEYNIRFGDPEAQVLLPLLDASWSDVFYQIAKGHMPQLKWKNLQAACVVLAAQEYPHKIKSVEVKGDPSYKSKNTYFLQGGVKKDKQGWRLASGRALNSVALATDIKEACKLAYDQISKISWKGIRYRKDIGS